MRNRGIAFRLILLTLSGTMGVFLSAFACFYLLSETSMIKDAEKSARNLIHFTAERIEKVLRGVEKTPLNYAFLLSANNYEQGEITRLAEGMVSANPEIYGAAIAFEPGMPAAGSYYFSPYSYRSDGGLASVMLGGESYDYFSMDWYRIPRELNSPVWTEPYYDEGGGNMLMATFAVPFYNTRQGEKRFQGVVTSDISLHWLQQTIEDMRLAQTACYAFLISRKGVFITHPDNSLVMKGSLFSLAEEKGSSLLRQIGVEMIAGGESFVALESGLLHETKCWLYYAPLPSIGWSFGVVVPENVLLASVYRFGHMVILTGGVSIFLMIIVVMFIARRISSPLRELSATTIEIARGNLDTQLPDIQGSDEIATLTRSFEEMRLALKDYIKHLTETTAAKERIESELKIARNIQMSFLPKPFPKTGRNGIEISALLEPAREIGGDLYDYFPIDDDHLFFAVGDVSDKGIPAALFMAVTKTLLKGIAESGIDPSEILRRCNLELYRENDSMMFVTVFCGILNLRTGRLRYSNAGHEKPILVRRDSQPEFLNLPAGFLLGVDEESTYQTMEITLKPGDTLIVYTDGVNEAMNYEGEFYSRARLMAVVRSCSSLSAESIAAEILASVERFSTGIPQADDITVLALSYTYAKN